MFEISALSSASLTWSVGGESRSVRQLQHCEVLQVSVSAGGQRSAVTTPVSHLTSYTGERFWCDQLLNCRCVWVCCHTHKCVLTWCPQGRKRPGFGWCVWGGNRRTAGGSSEESGPAGAAAAEPPHPETPETHTHTQFQCHWQIRWLIIINPQNVKIIQLHFRGSEVKLLMVCVSASSWQNGSASLNALWRNAVYFKPVLLIMWMTFGYQQVLSHQSYISFFLLLSLDFLSECSLSVCKWHLKHVGTCGNQCCVSALDYPAKVICRCTEGAVEGAKSAHSFLWPVQSPRKLHATPFFTGTVYWNFFLLWGI